MNDIVMSFLDQPKFNNMRENEHILRYIKYMKRKWFWNDFDDTSSLYGQLKKKYLIIRPYLSVVSFIVNAVGLYHTEKMGMLDGSLMFLPFSVQMVAANFMIHRNIKKHKLLITSMNKSFIEHNEPWMVTIRSKYITYLWKIITRYDMYVYFVSALYVFGSLLMDTILHYVFDYLSHPLFLPLMYTPYIGSNATWNLKYYTIILMDLWNSWELLNALLVFTTCCSTVTIFFLTEVKIFKEKVKALQLEAHKTSRNVKFLNVISLHERIIKLHKELNAFLGLPCAFQMMFITIVLTLALFTSVTSTNVTLVLSYGSGFISHLLTGLALCSLGQLLQNESDEIFLELYKLPWYRCSPSVRKDLNMMMRQARSPLVIDYHGRSRLNLANFTQVIRSSYSYFTLMRSVATK